MDELTDQQQAQLRSQLEDRRSELRSQLEQLEQHSQPVTLDQQSVGRVSRIDAIAQQQVAVASRRQATLLLKQVQAALNRLESGDYGYCLQCGETIGPARLQAQPQAPLCLNCQAQREQ